MAALIFAAEMIFSLPFHVARFFRPTLLDALNLTNTQLGDVFAMYGIVAMVSYFPGGLIADKFSARNLIVLSLVATALGGFYYYTLPSVFGLTLLFAYWGLTSILLFWAAMIKATREWADESSQGLAFGLLDGGRGLVASVFASLGVFILAFSFSGTAMPVIQQQEALQSVILFYTLSTLAAAFFIWWLLPNGKKIQHSNVSATSLSIKTVLSNKNVWLQAGIVIAAYCGYKALDNYGLYAVQVMAMTDVEASKFTAYASYSRPVAAVVAGLLADRYSAGKMVLQLFAFACFIFISLALISPDKMANWLILTNLIFTFIAVYALRAIYFCLIQQSRVQLSETGKAVGIISLLGFTPDIFFASVTGRILDDNPGIVGFQYYFLAIAMVSGLGLLLAYWLVSNISKIKIT